VDGAAMARELGIAEVHLINDFEAQGYGILTLDRAKDCDHSKSIFDFSLQCNLEMRLRSQHVQACPHPFPNVIGGENGHAKIVNTIIVGIARPAHCRNSLC